MIQIDGMSRDELSSSVDAPTWAVRAKCAERIARGYCGNKLDPPTRQAA
ncbi:MAG: hypothetical protein JWL84_5974, partial [Rhodospirillales bacterium]|nr:hypothetical protein [Rhodospirillales bacterium]